MSKGRERRTLGNQMVVGSIGRACGFFCPPYAGAGASIYRSWSTGLPAAIEICAVQLPGRERRIAELVLR